jgi:hypothetical protein
MIERFGEKLLSRKYGLERNDTAFDREFNCVSDDVQDVFGIYLFGFG